MTPPAAGAGRERGAAVGARRGWLMRGSHLAADRPGALALACVAFALAPRVWTALTMPGAAAYATFPWWAQAAVMAAYAGQLGAETWAPLRVRALAAVVCVVVASMSAGVFARGDWRAGNAAFWAMQAAIELGLVCWLARRIGHGGG